MYIGDVKTLMITLTTLCLCVYTATAQDTLLLLNGDDLYVKVEKIDGATISYTIPPDTTLFTLNKEEVFMVKFANGTRYTIYTPQPKQVSREKVKEALTKKLALGDYERYKKGYQRRKVSGIVLLSIGGAFATTGITLICEGIRIDRRDYANLQNQYNHYQSTYYSPRGMWMSVGGGVLTGASFPFLLIGTINISLMPKYKRKMNEARQQLSFAPVTQPLQPVGNIGGSYTGMAMRISF